MARITCDNVKLSQVIRKLNQNTRFTLFSPRFSAKFPPETTKTVQFTVIIIIRSIAGRIR